MALLARRCVAALCAMLAASASLHGAALQEYQVKAVFLFNFTQFVDWPAGAFADNDGPITICVLGKDPFGSYLDDAVRGEHVDKRALTVRRVEHTDEIDPCQILFISDSEAGRIDAIIARARGMLTVSDARGFGERGGMVGFVTEDDHVRLRINIAAAKAAGLTISSKLLRVAEVVGPRTEPP